jgi:hypothetical protein
MVLAAGFILIALGIGALYWSRALASEANAPANGWWEGTLQALGVGFAVGGLVDVLAVSGLEGVIRSEEGKRKNFNTCAYEILGSQSRDKQEVLALLSEREGLLDKDLRAALYAVVTDQPEPGA